MLLLVQEYLKTHTFAELEREHGVEASFSGSGHKFSLNYNMINSKEDDVLSQQCRGLILAPSDFRPLVCEAEIDEVKDKANYDDVCPGDTIIVACPFFRFFNEGQKEAANINWNDPKLKIFEKLDGSLCIVHYSPIESVWCVATRSVPDANILMDNGKFTFRTLFEKAVLETLSIDFNEFTNLLDPSYTYCFELNGPWNKVVCEYNENRITLLGARDLRTLEEVHLDHSICAPFPKVKNYSLSNLEETIDYVNSRPGKNYEGVVVCDSNFNRVKIKSSEYVMLHKLCDGVARSPRNMLRLILNGQEDDAMTVLAKEISDEILKIKEKLSDTIKIYDITYKFLKDKAEAKNPGDKKTFALLVQEYPDFWAAPFFQMYGNKADSMLDYINKAKKDNDWHDHFLEKILEIL
jgi:hypothetical protein